VARLVVIAESIRSEMRGKARMFISMCDSRGSLPQLMMRGHVIENQVISNMDG
jgi:hypothetical protein